jgi:ribonuclease P protein component
MLARLKRHREFVAVSATRRKWVAPGFVLQIRRHEAVQGVPVQDVPAQDVAARDSGTTSRIILLPPLRLGLTASRKTVGGAVLRNRARRRLRALAQEIIEPHVRPGHDLVLIARERTVRLPFASLRADLTTGLKRLGLWQECPDSKLSPKGRETKEDRGQKPGVNPGRMVAKEAPRTEMS